MSLRTSSSNTHAVNSCNSTRLLPVSCSAHRPTTKLHLSLHQIMSQSASSPSTAAAAVPQRPWWQRPFLGLAGATQQQHKQGMRAGRGFTSVLFSSASELPVVQSASDARGPTHLIVMVNGLFGSAGNWDVISEQLQQHLDPQQTLLHPSTANSLFATYDGIDTCGTRLADEIRAVVAGQPHLRRISILAHSMGGLMARYAIGILYNPASCTICGLEPAHFITMATPHFGCDADGVAQVPFIGWTNEVPLLGQQLFRLLQDISAPAAALIFRRTGQQFFMLDGKQQQQQGASGANASSSSSSADLPVLLQMTQDCKDRGLFFYSALAAFKTRTCYANTGSDHLVGFANSSIRSMQQLPPLPPAASTAKGVVREDPLSAAFFPHAWQQLQQHWQQQQQGGGQAQAATEPVQAAAAVPLPQAPGGCVDHSTLHGAISKAYQPSRLQWTEHDGAEAQQRWHSTAAEQPTSWHEIRKSSGTGTSSSRQSPGSWVPVPKGHQQQQQQQGVGAVAVLELAASGAAAAATEAVAELLAQPMKAAAATAGVGPAAAAAAAPRSHLASSTAAADSADDLMQLDTSSLVNLGQPAAAAAVLLSAAAGQQGNSSSSSANAPGPAAAAAAAAEQDLTSGLGGSTPAAAAAASNEAAVAAVCADVAQLAGSGMSSRANMVAHMLHRMQELPWRRIDVSFQGARFGFAHNNIQVTRRWWNFEGVAVPSHLAQQLQLMDALVLQERSGAQQQQQQQLPDKTQQEIGSDATTSSAAAAMSEVPVDVPSV